MADDFLDGPVLHFQPSDEGAILWIQDGEQFLHQFGDGHLIEGGWFRRGAGMEVVEETIGVLGEVGHAPFRSGGLGADGIPAVIDGDARNPVVEGDGSPVLVQVLEHLREDFLGEVLLRGSAGQVGVDDAHHEGVEVSDEFTGGILFQTPDPAQQFR